MASVRRYTFIGQEKGFSYSEREFSIPSPSLLQQLSVYSIQHSLSNEKPSAIFRLRGTFSTQTTLTHAVFQSPGGMEGDNTTAVLGIAVEPLDAIQAQLASMPSSVVRSPPTGVSDPTVLAEKIVKHLFNFLSSFGSNGGGVSPDTFIQLSAITRWYESFLSKIRAGGIGFLERQD